ncbi:MAG: DedA family protein [Sciscionella sp.]
MQHFITDYGALAVFILMVAESACIPIPSEVIMLAGGAFAGSQSNLVAIIVAGAIGNLVGSYLAYALGRYAGVAVVRRWGGSFWLRENDLLVAHRWFERFGSASVFFGRLLPVVRTFISLPAGFAEMASIRFGAYTLLGCIPWTAGLGIAGYALGTHWTAIATAFHGATYVVAALVVIVVLFAVAVFLRRRRRNTVREEMPSREQ